LDAHAIFVSHEWLSWEHPDPEGVQIRTLCRTLERLQNGEIKYVRQDLVNEIVTKHKVKTGSKEWNEILDNGYIWFDFLSIPQPTISVEDTGSEVFKKLQRECKLGVRSIPGYVERSDIMIIVAPACDHKDRKNKSNGKPHRTGYRSWRNRGWCLLEMYASFFRRDRTYLDLMVNGCESQPKWVCFKKILFLSKVTKLIHSFKNRYPRQIY